MESLYEICSTVSWTKMYAKQPLDESHPNWEIYFAYSEWFRHRICSKLKLRLDTEWSDIYKKVGFLVKEEYSTEEEWTKAYALGQAQTLDDESLGLMLTALEKIKYIIVERI